MKKIPISLFVSFLILVSLSCLNSCKNNSLPTTPLIDIEEIKADFLKPPPETRPGCYWYWINDNISKEGITKDLEAMARVGIGRAYIGHIYNYSPPPEGQPANARNSTPLGDVKFMSDEWWEAVQWAVKEAERCGVEIGFFNSPGWSQSGGPWVKPSQSMRYLAHSETHITGGKAIDQIIPPPDVNTYPMAGGSRPVQTGPKFTVNDFQDVRLIAFRVPEAELEDIDMSMVQIYSDDIEDIELLVDGSEETVVFADGDKGLVINLTLPESDISTTGVQSLMLKSLDDRCDLSFVLESSSDGDTYKNIGEYSEQRGHQGPKKKEPFLVPFKETKDRYLRLTISSNREIRLAEMSVSRRAVLGGYVRKQLGETDPSTNPAWDAYVWGSQTESSVNSVVVSENVIDLSSKMDENGRLNWDAPEGNWLVLRMGMIPIGTQNAPSSPESRGLEVDKMNREHVSSLFDGMIGEFLRRTPEEDRKALKYIIADSYETGPQNWTDGFAVKFEARFGYSPEPFMPVLTGRVVDNPEISNRFLWDMRRMIVEGIAYDYVGGLREISNDNNLTLWLENYGHWGFPSEFLLYGGQTNQVGGEFWVGEVSDNIECRSAVSSAHIYGKKSIYAESFTSGQNFRESPASLKKWCDWVYGVGVNHLILHVYIHQPDERKPGIIQWFGTDFNRHNTWFEQSRSFIDYTRRSSVMLKTGIPVVDVAYYIGEDGPMMQGPMKPKLPDGYNFDFINSDVLINRATVENGRIKLKDGPAFSVLVLPKQTKMRPEVAEAIKSLVEKGANVVGPKPNQSPSLENYPACDQVLAATVNEIWGEIDGISVVERKYGEGRVFNGLDLTEIFDRIELEEDIKIISDSDIRCATAGSFNIGIADKGGIVFNHRRGKYNDIYFIANTSDEDVSFTASLRRDGLKPSLWNAVTGEIKECDNFTQKDGRTLIPLHLESSESIFIVLDENLETGNPMDLKSKQIDVVERTEIETPWLLTFEKDGGTFQQKFDRLISWTDHQDPFVRSYSGSVTYKNVFNLDKIDTGSEFILSLGKVSVIADIALNGNFVGTVWTTPWEIDISDYIEEGENDLEIRLSNTWNNRVFTDSKLPLNERKTYISQPYNFKANGDSLHQSGLIGPVLIKKLRR